ncbi:hypothetical protein CJU90_6849 [Yarrowia sp. C11]|nr:hypothetical protein CJU90_6849 [Yarrowia sp. C11]KAG5364488.1 hypothetical protein CKK34_3296 [Yarrowia sp. E02]
MSYYSRRNRDAQAAPPAAVSKKVPIDKSQQLLKSLLRESDNKVCADCKTATHPRWASWNLGCFICIRCSGIHRGMGTHISRVKSVDLDAWTEEQLASMMKWGNTRCNMFWEAKLPKGHVPDDNKIENFIRTKYDMKKWAASTTVPDPDTLGGASHASAPVQAPPKDTKIAGPPQVAKKAPATQQSSLIGLDFDEPAQTQHKPAQHQQPQQTQKHDDFLSFTQSPPQTQQPPQQQQQQQQQSPTQQQFQAQQPFPSASAPDSSRPDLKKSILSLYANSRQAPVVQQQQQQQQQQFQQQQFQQQQFQQQQFQQQSGGDFGGFGNMQQANSGFGNMQQANSGLGGFGGAQQNNAHNDWADAAAPKKQEDDVFANVWK